MILCVLTEMKGNSPAINNKNDINGSQKLTPLQFDLQNTT